MKLKKHGIQTRHIPYYLNVHRNHIAESVNSSDRYELAISEPKLCFSELDLCVVYLMNYLLQITLFLA